MNEANGTAARVRLAGALAWARRHRTASLALACALALAATVALQAAFPADEAEAVAPLVIAGVGGLIGALVAPGAVDAAMDTATDGVAGWLRTWINSNLDQANNFLTKYLTDGWMLTRDFDQLFSSVVPVLRSVQETVVIPLAMIVLTVFFVAGIASAVAEMGRAESGIDTVQLMMVFVAYALVGSLVVNSWELMAWCYDLVTQVIAGIGGTVNTEVYTGLPEDVNNIGVLLSLLVTSGVVWVIAGAVALLTQVIIITRAIQIYVYTCLAPASIAFLVSPKSRPMATGFLKRYLALLFAGVIMALLFAMMSAILAGFGDIAVAASDYEGMIDWSGRLLFSCVSLLAYGYAMWSAGGWAREFAGV